MYPTVIYCFLCCFKQASVHFVPVLLNQTHVAKHLFLSKLPQLQILTLTLIIHMPVRKKSVCFKLQVFCHMKR